MTGVLKTIGVTVIAGGAIAATANNAIAACASIAGTWGFYAIQAGSPNIKSTTTTVKNSANANTTIKVFPNAGMAFDNATAIAIKCTLTFNANGKLASSPCTSFGVVAGDGGNVNISGNIVLNPTTCQITGGTINAGDPTKVTIRGGSVNGNTGAGIATQGFQVFLFNLVKQ